MSNIDNLLDEKIAELKYIIKEHNTNKYNYALFGIPSKHFSNAPSYLRFYSNFRDFYDTIERIDQAEFESGRMKAYKIIKEEENKLGYFTLKEYQSSTLELGCKFREQLRTEAGE